MNIRANTANTVPQRDGSSPKGTGLYLGGPWPVTINIVLLKLAGLGILLAATLSVLNVRERAIDGLVDKLRVQSDALVVALAIVERTREQGELREMLAAAINATGEQATMWNLRGEGVTTSPGTPHQWVDAAEAMPAGVADALSGKRMTWRDERSDDVTVATPVQDIRGSVVGVLELRVLSDPAVMAARDEERDIITLFVVAGAVLIVNAIVIALIINRRLVSLAQAAERVRAGASALVIPGPHRRDTVGELAASFRAMALSLTHRMAATEAFAAEVAHELKSPLTSLRSAAETLPLARNDKARDGLLAVISHDVRRIDRLINDISDASRLDRELARVSFVQVDLTELLGYTVAAEAELAAKRDQSVTLHFASPADAFATRGNDLRLGQVFTNILDNARSFTPEGGNIIVTARRRDRVIEVLFDDEGPGIEEAVQERIFERFYTDRPGQSGFGNNSGLGLAISRQIVSAHGGEIFAHNRYKFENGLACGLIGACFTVRLPAG